MWSWVDKYTVKEWETGDVQYMPKITGVNPLFTTPIVLGMYETDRGVVYDKVSYLFFRHIKLIEMCSAPNRCYVQFSYAHNGVVKLNDNSHTTLYRALQLVNYSGGDFYLLHRYNDYVHIKVSQDMGTFLAKCAMLERD